MTINPPNAQKIIFISNKNNFIVNIEDDIEYLDDSDFFHKNNKDFWYENNSTGKLLFGNMSKNEKFLNDYKKSDIFLIGFKKGEKVFSKELIKKLLTMRRQKPIFLIEGALPGNIDPSVSKLSNLFLFDLNDLEQFFSFFNHDKINEKQNILLDEIEKNENLNSFFKKLNFNLSQKQIFFDNLNAFLLREGDINFKKKIYNFFESFRE